MSQVLFEMSDSLCQRYPSLNPFIIRQTRAMEVFRLIRNIRISKKYQKENSSNVQQITSNTNGVIKRVNVTGKRGTGGWI